MILEKRGLGVAEFSKLSDFLGDMETENLPNVLFSDDMYKGQGDLSQHLVARNRKDKGSPFPLCTFCRLIDTKPSYEDDYLLFDVVVEIPDTVFVTNQEYQDQGADEASVDTEKFLLMLNAIFMGEDPEEALKRLTPRT